MVESIWWKEPELKALKDDLIKIDRQIQLSLKPIEESEGQSEVNGNGVSGIPAKAGTHINQESSMSATLIGVKEIMGDRLVVASVGNGPIKAENKEITKGFKI